MKKINFKNEMKKVNRMYNLTQEQKEIILFDLKQRQLQMYK